MYKKNRQSVHQPKHFNMNINEPEHVCCKLKPDCEGCPYAGHGFMCHGSSGKCMRDQLEAITERDGSVLC